MLDLSPLAHAHAALARGLTRFAAAPSDLEVCDGCIQRSKFTFELSWKMLRRRLQMDLPNAQEVDSMTSRGLMRAGAEHGLIDDIGPWLVYRDRRNGPGPGGDRR